MIRDRPDTWAKTKRHDVLRRPDAGIGGSGGHVPATPPLGTSGADHYLQLNRWLPSATKRMRSLLAVVTGY